MRPREVQCPHCTNTRLQYTSVVVAICPRCGCTFQVGREALVIIHCNGCQAGQRECHPERPRAQRIEKDPA